MTRNDDGSVTLTLSEASGVDALIVAMDRRSRNERSYSNQEASVFARNWVLRDHSQSKSP
jgi:hypothetical protein